MMVRRRIIPEQVPGARDPATETDHLCFLQPITLADYLN
jgi:hypothetical protein